MLKTLMRVRSSSERKKPKELTTDNQKILWENKWLNGELNDLRHPLQENQGRTNQLAQYPGSS